MPELATKADIAELQRLLERQSWQLTVHLGGLYIACLAIVAMLSL